MRDAAGFTPLLAALASYEPDDGMEKAVIEADGCVRVLLEAGASTARAQDGTSPLYAACRHGAFKSALLLLKHDGALLWHKCCCCLCPDLGVACESLRRCTLLCPASSHHCSLLLRIALPLLAAGLCC